MKFERGWKGGGINKNVKTKKYYYMPKYLTRKIVFKSVLDFRQHVETIQVEESLWTAQLLPNVTIGT